MQLNMNKIQLVSKEIPSKKAFIEIKDSLLKSWGIILKQQNGACFMTDRPDETPTRPYLNNK